MIENQEKIIMKMEQEPLPDPEHEEAEKVRHLSPVIRSILIDCELTDLAESLCFQCRQATVLQLSSPDGVQNAAVIHCAALSRDIQVTVARCTSHLPQSSEAVH
ncbi:hypothetical protein XEUV181_01980 [Xanthomonas euvesicatoria]|nr:hypothetical protein BHE83_20455 [Xanthomonas euvesicatoria pv. vesicatoria str. 85-10]KHL63720.1 hypothetical protein XEU66b_01690 [Xanthomonas euvesicatoria]KHL67299.1 hypothetical protein XEU83M_02100 [Xanthomonas euvesicatoria]KLA53166.1 hypothetical protein XEUV685_15710 [Xanthomonas euvesicatoria]KLA57070.1 hypothetical protein XEUV683_02310 [Xanthomonas euvesicatoria]